MPEDIGSVNRNPDNINFLSTLEFKFNVRKLPHISWFVQQVAIPGITLGEVIHPTPFMDTYQPGEKLEYDPLTITFKVDEPMNTWTELQNWMIGIGSPTSFGEYASNLRRGPDAIISDATLSVLNSNMNPIFEILFHDLFPTALGELQFNSMDTEVEYFTINATFRYLNYEFRKINR